MFLKISQNKRLIKQKLENQYIKIVKEIVKNYYLH